MLHPALAHVAATNLRTCTRTYRRPRTHQARHRVRSYRTSDHSGGSDGDRRRVSRRGRTVGRIDAPTRRIEAGPPEQSRRRHRIRNHERLASAWLPAYCGYWADGALQGTKLAVCGWDDTVLRKKLSLC